MTHLWLRVAALKLLSDRAVAAYARVRKEAETSMDRGDRKIVYVPGTRTKLGAVSMSDPKPVAGIGDQGAFTEWAKAHYPDDVDFDMEIVGPEDEVKAALYQHARSLVKLVERVNPSLRAAVLEASNAYGAPAGPNGELDVPGVIVAEAATSRVSFLPSGGSAHAVTELVRAGKVDLPDLLDEPTVDNDQ